MVRFVHLADLHVGAWRDEKLCHLAMEVFRAAIDFCISEKVDFVLFAGDLFNTALPAIDKLKVVTRSLYKLKLANIPLYVIAGSHDFSPSGKTMIDVLENAGLFINVCKGEVNGNLLKLRFTVDPKTGVKITGMLGKKGMLDHKYYEQLDRTSLEQEPGYKIFMFHTTLSELKPKHLEHMEGHPLSLLPKGFDYYAGGHVHHPSLDILPGFGPVAYTGALFPNSFAELEKYGHGGFYLVEDEPRWVPLKLKETVSIKIDANDKVVDQVEEELVKFIENSELSDAIVTIRVAGVLASGRASDISWNDIYTLLEKKNAYVTLRNTAALKSKEFVETKIEHDSVEDIEIRLIKEHVDPEKQEKVIQILKALDIEKQEGETFKDFEKRIISNWEKSN